MAYLAESLIERALFLSGIVARNAQTPTGDQINDGLFLLNEMLDFKQVDTDLIPYWSYIEMPLIANTEFYFLPNVADVESSTFNIGVVRYPMETVTRRKYFASSRVDNISTLPFSYNYNRGEGGGTLSLYFLPQANYPQKMMVKLFLTDVTLTTDLVTAFSPLSSGFVSSIQVTNGGTGYTQIPTITITGGNGTGATAFASVSNGVITSINVITAGAGYSQTPTVVINGNGTGAVATAITNSYTFLQTTNAGYDKSYIAYLRYSLAAYICSEFGVEFNPQSAKILQAMERKLMYVSPPDLSSIKSSVLTSAQGLNYGDINIGRGYRPD